LHIFTLSFLILWFWVKIITLCTLNNIIEMGKSPWHLWPGYWFLCVYLWIMLNTYKNETEIKFSKFIFLHVANVKKEDRNRKSWGNRNILLLLLRLSKRIGALQKQRVLIRGHDSIYDNICPAFLKQCSTIFMDLFQLQS
jgi:hypothetical protein